MTGNDILDTIIGLLTAGSFGAAFVAFRAWVVTHALKALEIEGPRAVAQAANAYAAAVDAGRNPLDAAEDAAVAAKAYLLATISGPLDKLKKSDTVINATVQGVAAQAIQQATKLGLPSAFAMPLQAAVGVAAPLVATLAEGEAQKVADLITKVLSAPAAAPVAAPVPAAPVPVSAAPPATPAPTQSTAPASSVLG